MAEQTLPDGHLAELMRSAQEGDAAAYLELLRVVTPHLRRIVEYRRGFAGRENVEDLVQDILLSLHAVRATYDPRRPFMPWLLAIVRHRLADGARRYARTAANEVSLHDNGVTFSAVGANTGSESSGDAFALREAIGALPRGQRQAIEMLKLEGLSLKEAAAARGSTVGAMKVATHRAMATLRALLRGTRDA